MRVSDILRVKGSKVETVAPSDTILFALVRLAEVSVGALVVSIDQWSIDGIISERDIVRALPTAPNVGEMKVEELMTAKVRTCNPDQEIDELMVTMTQARIRHMPVVDKGRLSGIISIGDVVKVRLGELERERTQLYAYIAGR